MYGDPEINDNYVYLWSANTLNFNNINISPLKYKKFIDSGVTSEDFNNKVTNIMNKTVTNLNNKHNTI